jgi:hypothetical protein
MTPPTGQHNRPGPASSPAAASEPAPAGGPGQGADGHAGSNGTPGMPSARRALHARDAAARASEAVPEQRGPDQRGPEQRGPDQSGPEQRGPERRVPEQRGPEQRGPEQRGPGPPGRASAGSDQGSSEPDGVAQRESPGAAPSSSRPGEADEPGTEFSIQAIEPGEGEVAGPNRLADLFSAAGRRLVRLGLALVVIAARDWLEAIAVLLQGVGGAIYPPIWFIGALITAISKKWDLRDKWLGLALPVLAVIFGATLTIVLGGQHSSLGAYALEGWLAVGRLSRIAAVLGAVYLLWRLHRGLREPRQPSWSRPPRRG